ncbi:DEAD/DEAH box helicase [Cupriavidus sp. SS-3]|uniref:DEAD/DEAH box helicase n=1 Tax=Cupriavidus sp. SS-3 TaxID=3109596 RepID=UPI003FA3A91F
MPSSPHSSPPRQSAQPDALPDAPGAPEVDWQQALDALRALAGTDPATAQGAAAPARRLLWALTLDADGAPGTIEPLEQVRGPKGWGKPRPVPLARIAEDDRLEPWDARVARAIRRDASHNRRYVLDRAMALMALAGHPGVVLAHAPTQTLDVVEDAPALEAVRSAGRYVLRLFPPVRGAPALEALLPAAARQEAEALRQFTLLRDGPHRLRLIRYTPAQFEAARLIGDGLAIPEEGHARLDQTLRALAGQFQIQADAAAGSRAVEAEARLRAEVAPVGRGISLRLVVTPLGPLGPRLAPGAGRERLMATVRGETLSTQRDLDAELASVAEVFAALPQLVALSPPGGEYTWALDDPEDALAVVEALPSLPAVQAVEWPRGKELRVLPADLPQLGVQVESRGAWYKLAGELRVAEGLVLELGKLIDWTGSHAGRFVPMGQGVYVALTQVLRGRLRDLAGVGERFTDGTRDGIRVPQMATPWLDDVLAGAGVDPDAHFRARIDRLRAARESEIALPATLAAELRPYQEAGYRWAMTLAASGLGACLADDMGLGKTLQALAVLVARAGGGAALVIAPTSVCGNWAAEARRFAPTLNVHVYAEGDRDALLAQAGPHDVVIVSYTLLQQASDAFCARAWHTVVADEAQAFKNAVTRRAQAMFALPSDFRMALTGTPVENRLAELWSVMRFCNPGLLGSLARFNEHFANPIERAGSREARLRLRRMVAPFVLRRTKAQVLDELPPRTELVIRVEPEPVEAAHYEALRRQAQTEAEAALARVEAARKASRDAPAGARERALAQAQHQAQARLHVLAQLMRLRRAACDPRLVTPEVSGQLSQGAKVRAFVELASGLAASGHKTLVFSQFVDFLQLLRQGLEHAGLALQYLDGATPAAERTRRVAAFQAGEGDVFLISLKAGGFGLNLTAADYVIIADPWWNPAAEDQAMGRAHRIGQQRPVTVYRLINAGTIEERIVELHRDKRALADGLLEADDDHAAGTGAPLPDVDELVGLLRR